MTTEADAYMQAASGLVLALVIYVANDQYKRWTDRRSLRQAILTETKETTGLVEDFFKHFPNKQAASDLKKAVFDICDGQQDKGLDFETLDAIPAGWNFFTWSFPLDQALSKLSSPEGKALLLYSDAWAQVSAFQGQLREDFLRLVAATSHISDEKYGHQLKEYATMTEGSLKGLAERVEQLSEKNEELARVVRFNHSSMTLWAVAWVSFGLFLALGFAKVAPSLTRLFEMKPGLVEYLASISILLIVFAYCSQNSPQWKAKLVRFKK